MKFFGRGIVWDKENNKRLCKFENGELVTEDERVIKTLTDLGYKHDTELVEIKPTEVKPVTQKPPSQTKKVNK